MASPHEKFIWKQILRVLDEAGFAIVRKPELMDKGKTKRRFSV